VASGSPYIFLMNYFYSALDTDNMILVYCGETTTIQMISAVLILTNNPKTEIIYARV
jgi:acetaldehyde dehydrogenase (acetylating)